MTHAELRHRLEKDNIIYASAILHHHIRQKMDINDTNILMDLFINMVMDCMFEKNMDVVRDAKMGNAQHMVKVDCFAYQCVNELLNLKNDLMLKYLEVMNTKK